MFDLKKLYHRYRRYLLFLLAIYFLGLGITPYRSIFGGLIFGTTLSYLNLWLMVKKTEQLSEAVKHGRKIYSIGTFSRMASVALAVLIAIKYPAYFHILGTILGVMTIYIVIMIDSLIIFLFKRNQREVR